MVQCQPVIQLLKSLVVCLVLPLAFVACDNKQEDKDASSGGGSGAEGYTHESIATEALGYLEEAMGAFFAIKNQDEAKACLANVKEVVPKIQVILDRAKTLPAPTEEEKAAIQLVANTSRNKIDAVKEERNKEIEEEFKKEFLPQLNRLNGQGYADWKKLMEDSENLVEHDGAFRKMLEAYESLREIYRLEL